ncbi:MAG TPA: flavin reductase family protein [Acidimicrobiales bacterium]|nr:flavin reductase family protein [Acidimicrobiales bacterium]
MSEGYEGPVPDGRDPDEYDRLRRRVLWSLPTGLFVVGSRSGDRRNLMTANWVMQVAIVPKLVAVSVERGSVTASLIEEGGGFSVSVLSRADRALVRRFVKPVEDIETDGAGVVQTMQGESVRELSGGLPRLVAAVAWLACRLRHTDNWGGADDVPPASHLLFVGEVVDAGERAPGGGVGDRPEVLRMEDTRMNYGG